MKLAVMMLTAALCASAQPPGRGFRGAAGAAGAAEPAPLDAVKTYLALTDAQLTGFQAIRQTAQTSAQPLQDQLRTKNQALRTALNATPIDSAAVTSLQAAIAALKTQLDKVQSDASAQMKALMGSDQQAKLATLEAAAALREQVQGASFIGLLPGGPGGPGPGGRGGPGGRPF